MYSNTAKAWWLQQWSIRFGSSLDLKLRWRMQIWWIWYKRRIASRSKWEKARKLVYSCPTLTAIRCHCSKLNAISTIVSFFNPWGHSSAHWKAAVATQCSPPFRQESATLPANGFANLQDFCLKTLFSYIWQTLPHRSEEKILLPRWLIKLTAGQAKEQASG